MNAAGSREDRCIAFISLLIVASILAGFGIIGGKSQKPIVYTTTVCKTSCSRIWLIYQLLALPWFLLFAEIQKGAPRITMDRVEGITGRPEDPTG
jgi:hypothetical protein